jgi:hypothetical protein
MSQADYNLLLGAVVAATVAVLGYLAAWFRAKTGELTAHVGAIAATNTRGGGGRRTDPAPPVWNQLADPGVGGELPAGRYEECGEECVSMVVMAQHGVPTAADQLRVLLGGAARGPLTTGADLVRLLALCNVPAALEQPDGATLPAALRAICRDGGYAIVLGHWVSGTILHWILVTRADEDGMGANDPWMGRRRTWTWPAAAPLYAGEIVTIVRQPDAR